MMVLAYVSTHLSEYGKQYFSQIYDILYVFLIPK
jgi:hypothetical protein